MSTPEPINPLLQLWKLLHPDAQAPIATLPAVHAQPLDRAPDPQAVLDRQGILPQQRLQGGALAHRVADAAYASIEPYGYGLRNLHDGTVRPALLAKHMLNIPAPPRAEASAQREDAWRMYLGMPQKSGSLEVSRYKPSRGDPKGTYYRVPGLFGSLLMVGPVSPGDTWGANATRKQMQELLAAIDAASSKGEKALMNDGLVMGTFKLEKGKDARGHYISYYDKWDLSQNPLEGRVGKPFEIYDRLYYDPKTLLPLSDR